MGSCYFFYVNPIPSISAMTGVAGTREEHFFCWWWFRSEHLFCSSLDVWCLFFSSLARAEEKY